MYKIFKDYSIFNREVGYCQGMSFVCAALLINKLTEEESFWMFVGIMDIFQENYSVTMTGILANNEDFKDLLYLTHPAIFNQMERLQAVTVIFISRWFLTLYTDLKHWQTVLRLWDVIFFEGKSSLLRIAVSIINCCEKQIIECNQFGELGAFLINIPKEIIQPKYLLPALFSIDIEDLLKKLDNLRLIKASKKNETSPTTSTLSQMSQFWTEYNQTPQKFVSNKPHSERSMFSFSIGFLTNKLGNLSISPANPNNHPKSLHIPEGTPDKKRSVESSSDLENPLKKPRSTRLSSFFSK